MKVDDGKSNCHTYDDHVEHVIQEESNTNNDHDQSSLALWDADDIL